MDKSISDFKIISLASKFGDQIYYKHKLPWREEKKCCSKYSSKNLHFKICKKNKLKYQNYKKLFKNKYPDYQIKEINEKYSLKNYLLSSKYFFYIIFLKIMSTLLKIFLFTYLFIIRKKGKKLNFSSNFLYSRN